MKQTALNLVAITIFVFTMSSLLGPLFHLPPGIPAIAAAVLLGFATLDTWGWQGRGGNLLLDWLSRFSPAYRDRVLRHEAGHFLTAHLLDIPITGYTLSAWESFRQGQPGEGGVTVDAMELQHELDTGVVSDQLIDRYCTVWMAGIAAETLVYGTVEGGAGDRETIRTLWSQLRRSPSAAELKERWAVLQAKNLIQTYQSAYDALVDAMQRRAPVTECQQLIDQYRPTALT